MTVILPIIAALSVTVRVEPAHRPDHLHPRPAPGAGPARQGASAAVLVALAATVVAFTVGALGNVAGAQLTGIDPVWDGDPAPWHLRLGDTLLLLIGFTLGALIRSSAGAIVAYMVYAFVLPGCSRCWRCTRTGSATCARGSTPS